MSKDFWKLMKWWEQHPECEVEFAVNSNLGQKDALFEELLKASHNIKSFHLYTSCEAVGIQAEYIRDGLVWDKWITNMDRMLGEGNVQSSNCMMTINALCLFSLPEFMDEMLKLKKKHNTQSPVCSFNILRFPSFQSIVTLPKEIRVERADAIEKWINDNWDDEKNGFIQWEKDSMTRLVTYIREVSTGHAFTSSLESRERDFKSFYTQYDMRRGKNFLEAFPMLKEWWDSIPETNIAPLKGLVDGDDAKSNRYVDEVLDTAKKEGWVLDPQWANPGAQDYVEPEDDVDNMQNEMMDFINDKDDE
jgi:hypothetical protein